MPVLIAPLLWGVLERALIAAAAAAAVNVVNDLMED